jgi:HD-GYP domain-containing protein (c-di-GMP phosphodiesterase class II)
LTDVETNALHRHTAWSAALVELIEDEDGLALDEAVQLAVYQHHEREDGSGYPTRARAANIHDLARLVGVADTFIGLVSPRAHRPGVTADEALAAVVRSAASGVLARPFARGLVLALGLRASATPVVLGRRTAPATLSLAA